jgi:hypothetical protein
MVRRREGFVYFIRCPSNGMIKIGWTADDPERRLRALSTGSPEEFERLGTIPGSCADEAALHRLFADSRVRGEWFRPNREIIEYIRVYTGIWSAPPARARLRVPAPPRPPSTMAVGSSDDDLNAGYLALAEVLRERGARMWREQLQAPPRPS